jgi:hypothetical protein
MSSHHLAEHRATKGAVNALADPAFADQSLAALFTPGTFIYLARKIAQGHHVTRAELNAVKRSNPAAQIPAIVQDYEHRVDRGEVKRPGRPRASLSDCLRIYVARRTYPGLLRYLQSCNRRGKIPTHVRGVPVPKAGPMHERAAEMLRDRLFKHCSFRHVQNIIARETGPFE